MAYDYAPAFALQLGMELGLTRSWCVRDFDVHVRDRLKSGYIYIYSRRPSLGVVGGARQEMCH